MALDLTKQVEAALRAQRMFQDYEGRLSKYGALKAYMDGGNALLPKSAVENIKNAQNYRSLVFPVMQKASLSVITAAACDFTGAEGTSAKPSFSSIKRGFAIRVYPKVCDNNYISEMDHYANELVNGLRTVLANLDSYAVTQLEANKSTGLASAGLPTDVAIVANAYQLAATAADRLYFKLPVLAELNDVNSGNLVNVATTGSIERMIQYESNGQNNSQNLNAVLTGGTPSSSGYRHYTSNRVTNGSGVQETHYIIPFGGIGVFSFIDSQNRGMTENLVNNKKRYSLTDPVMGITWGVTEKPICTDLSATYGADYTEVDGVEYRFLADFGFMNAYSSDTTSPIHKVEVLSPA